MPALRDEKYVAYHERRRWTGVQWSSSCPVTLESWGLGKLAPGSLQLSDPSRATSSLLLLLLAAAPARTEADRMVLVHKVGKTEPCTQLEQFKLSRFLLSHLFVGSHFYWSLANAFGRFQKYSSKKTKKKKFLRSWSPVSSAHTDHSLQVWVMSQLRSCVAASQLHSCPAGVQIRALRDCMAHLC